MNTETTKAMQDALQAAVARMNNGNGNGSSEPRANPMDTIGALMTIVPKLLQGSESSGEMVEKLDTLQKTDITPLRGQVQILRKQCYRMLKSQEQLLEKVHEIQKEQTTVARAVLDLAHHMSRITFIEDPPADDYDYEREPPPTPQSYRRAESRTNGNGRGTKSRHTSEEHGPTSRAGRSK